MNCQYHGCATPLRGNPNDKQCDDCNDLFCSKHQRMVEWGIRLCVKCKPRVGRRRR